MENDKSKDCADYLKTWLSRHKAAGDLVPHVQRLSEEAQWQHSAWAAVRPVAPAHLRADVDARIDHAFVALKTQLPLPPDYGSFVSSAAASTVTSSTMSTYGAVLHVEDLNCIAPAVTAQHIALYQELQGRHNRSIEVRALLEQRFRRLTPQFDHASAAVQTAKSQPDKVPFAATEARNLVDALKGELLEAARRVPQENMTWKLMSDRLGTVPDPACGAQSLRDQEAHRRDIYGRLSDLIKHRRNAGSRELDAVWPLVLDHIFVVCGSVK